MVQITVSDELARQIAGASLPVVLVDSRGQELGEITRRSISPSRAEERNDADDDEWAEAQRQMEIYRREGGSFYTTKEVLDHLKSLEKELILSLSSGGNSPRAGLLTCGLKRRIKQSSLALRTRLIGD